MEPPTERFWRKVRKGSELECWIWTANKNNQGYGLFRPGGVAPKKLAHRISYEMINGPTPKGLNALHKCDNPICVNPAHIFLGTFKDNTQDMLAKGRHRFKIIPGARPPHYQGAAHPHAKLTDEIVLSARDRLANGEPLRPMARELRIDASTLRRIRDRKGWPHI